MARNSEKNLSELNRLYLQKQRQEEKNLNPPRPSLNTLQTSSEIRRWLPEIKGDIAYCLQQLSGVRNYSDKKIGEFEEKVSKLKKEYHRFVRRCFELDHLNPSVNGPQTYISKKEMDFKKVLHQLKKEGINEEFLDIQELEQLFKNSLQEEEIEEEIQTPLLEKEKKRKFLDSNSNSKSHKKKQKKMKQEESNKQEEFNKQEENETNIEKIKESDVIQTKEEENNFNGLSLLMNTYDEE